MGGSAAARTGAGGMGGSAGMSRKKTAKRLSPAAKEKDGARSVLFLCVGHARQPLTEIANVLPSAPSGTCLPVLATSSPKVS